MTNENYLVEYVTKRVDEGGNKDYQCVAFNKHHAKTVYGAPLGSFGGFAATATYKKGGTYDPAKWTKLTPGSAVGLLRGDHVIQKFGTTGHIGVVWSTSSIPGGEGYYMLEQNNGELDKTERTQWGNGDGLQNDAIMMRHYGWGERTIINIYRFKGV